MYQQLTKKHHLQWFLQDVSASNKVRDLSISYAVALVVHALHIVSDSEVHTSAILDPYTGTSFGHDY